MKKKTPAKMKPRPSPLALRLLACLRRNGALHAGDRVAAAVSGGADSIALLLLLLELRKELGIVLSVAHVNHQLRGRASHADEEFVAALAAKHQLEFHHESVDVAAKARREKANLEDAARRVRNDFFARLVVQGKVNRVAVAHTADDQAETVLAHILRGTGLAGLRGIHPETDNVVRPLLPLRRAELRAYLRSKKQKWSEDATNQDTARLRARIRKKLLPLLERDFHDGVVGHLCALAQFANEDEAFLDWMAAQRCTALARKEHGGTAISVVNLQSPVASANFNAASVDDGEKKGRGAIFEGLTKRMVRRLILERRRGTGQLTAQHIAAVLELARGGENGKALQLPGGVDVRRSHDELFFCPRDAGKSPVRQAQEPAPADYEYKIDLKDGAAALHVPEAGCVLRLRVIDWAKKREETSLSGAVLDRERLRLPLALRNWRPGDRMQPVGHRKAHKLKRLLNERHVSRWARDGWPVLTSGGALVWARGLPVAADYAPHAGTREGILVAEEMT